jgi:pyridoxal phosphate enzyme (YggS family)
MVGGTARGVEVTPQPTILRAPPTNRSNSVNPPESIADNLHKVRERIAGALERAGRPAQSVRLVAVCKFQPPEAIRAALAAGVTDLGENYVQEAEAAFAALGPAGEGVARHLIGSLQRNKAGKAAALFDVVQTVDRIELGAALGRRALALGRRLDVLIEVNATGEAAKAGVAPDEAAKLVEQLVAVEGIRLCGVMGMGPLGADEAGTRRCFAKLRGVFEQLPAECRTSLSMGMTGDFELAILEGSNLVRIGTAIFGERRYGAQPGPGLAGAAP